MPATQLTHLSALTLGERSFSLQLVERCGGPGSSADGEWDAEYFTHTIGHWLKCSSGQGLNMAVASCSFGGLCEMALVGICPVLSESEVQNARNHQCSGD